MRAEYREEPCKAALNRVKGMPFRWSLNPYMGCVHRCTFCYVRAFERRADRPSDDRYGRSIRVKTNIAEVLRRELARAVLGARGGRDRRGDRPVPAGRGPLPADPRVHRGAAPTPRNPFSIITRGPLIVRDVDVLVEAARRADVSVTFSVPTLDDEVWRTHRAGHRAPAAAAARAEDARRRGHPAPASAWRRSCPGISDEPELLERGRARGARGRRHAASGRTCSTCGRGRASTSSSASPRTGPSSSHALRAPYAGRAYLAAARERSRSAPQRRADSSAAARRRRTGAAPPRRPRPAEPEQLGPRDLTSRSVAARRYESACRSWKPAAAAEPAGKREITCLIVDDHEVVREGLRLSLSRAPHIRVDRRGVRRRERRHAGRAPPARRRDHGRAHARHGRARGDEAADRRRCPTSRC